MFIERVNKSDVQKFIGDDYKINQFELDTSLNGEKYIRINTTCGNSDYDFNHRLHDTLTTIGDSDKWIKFLYELFGDEYKNWYINEQLKIFE